MMGLRLPNILERYLLAAPSAAGLATLLAVTHNGLEPVQRPLSIGLVLWLLFGAAYLGAALLLGAAALAVARWPRASAAPRMVLSVASAAVLAAALGANLPAFWSLASPDKPRGWLVLAAFAAAVVALAAQAWLPAQRSTLARAVACLSAALTAGALWPVPASGVPMSLPAEPHTPGAPLLLIGLDGADWDWIDPLMRRGELPNLKALKKRGAWGRLATSKPTESPILWTTLATGRSPAVHGIHGFTVKRLAGVRAPLPSLRPIRGLGMPSLLQALRPLGLTQTVSVSSDLRRVPAFWNVATAQGSAVGVVNWWVTWPAEPVLGAIVSERVYYRPAARGRLEPRLRVTWPNALVVEVERLMMRPEQVTFDDARAFMDVTATEFEAMRGLPASDKSLAAQFAYFYSMTETDRRVALHLSREGGARHGRTPDLLVLFRLLDMICHTSLAHSELTDEHLDSTPEELRRYGRAVSAAHRWLDRIVGELVGVFGAEANVVIVSDHGFDLVSVWPRWERFYMHDERTQGVFLAAGPAFRPGAVEGLGLLDILPLLVRLKGFPVADDLEGRNPETTLGPLFVAPAPERRVATYGLAEPGAAAPASGLDAEQLERLRALGYVE